MERQFFTLFVSLVVLLFAYASSIFQLTGMDVATPSAISVLGNASNSSNASNISAPSGGSFGGGGGGSGSGGGSSLIIVDLDRNVQDSVVVNIGTRIKLIYDAEDYSILVTGFSSGIASFSADFGGFALVEGAEQQFEITGDGQRDVEISLDSEIGGDLQMTFVRLQPRTFPIKKISTEEPTEEEPLPTIPEKIIEVVEEEKVNILIVIAATIFVFIIIHWWAWHYHRKNESIK